MNNGDAARHWKASHRATAATRFAVSSTTSAANREATMESTS
jgi:hypothetical protein